MQLPKLVMASFFLAAILSAPAWGSTSANSALPGTLNYVEGQASIGSQALDSKSVGSVELKPGQSLTTENGKAEVLLTPGVFLRVGSNSSVEMISPSLTNTQVEVDKGQAMIEVAEIHPQNDIRITGDGVTAQLLKTGLYDFDLNQDQLRVFDGQASVQDGDRHVTVKGGHQVSFAESTALKSKKFDKKSYEESDLFRWSSLRSAYLAEANVDAAGIYAANGWGAWAPGWWGAGWYWDPWFSAYTFIPGDGIFYSPFGWGFYSPWWVYRAPYFGYGHAYHRFSADARTWGPGSHYVEGRTYAGGVYRGPGSTGTAFHSGSTMTGGARGFASSGGGFHGSGGGFHGSSGGGFHGGGGGGSHGR